MINVVNTYKHISQPGEIDYYIGRGSVLGNPFTHLKTSTQATTIVATREEAIAKYEPYLLEQIKLNNWDILNAINRLKDFHNNGEIINLVCYCKPKSCHGDFTKKLVEEITE